MPTFRNKYLWSTMGSIIRFIPNFLTLANLFCGFLALVFIANEEMVTAVWFIGASLVFDFFDGFVARWLNAQSELGVQLDSLADMVTFGAVPGFILFQMLIVTQGAYFTPIEDWEVGVLLNASVAALVPLAAAYRLAKFNLIKESKPHFVGLPTPAMSLVVLSIPLALEANYHLNFYHPLSDQFISLIATERRWDLTDEWLVKALFQPITYQVISVFLAVAMVSQLPMLSLKFKGLNWKVNKWSYVLVIWAVVCYLIFLIPYLPLGAFSFGLIDFLVLPIFMFGYFFLSLIYATFGVSKT